MYVLTASGASSSNQVPSCPTINTFRGTVDSTIVFGRHQKVTRIVCLAGLLGYELRCLRTATTDAGGRALMVCGLWGSELQGFSDQQRTVLG